MATNGVYIVMGEANSVVALLNKVRRQYQMSHQSPSVKETDPLLRNFADLKEVLNEMSELSDMNPLTYLSPFLDVIKNENTTGPVSEAALSAVAKFLNYGLIDASSIKAANAVESIAHAAVNTHFIGAKNPGSDECVLFKMMQVMRSLLLSPPGYLVSNEAVCDMIQSCIKVVFEQRFSLLLRKAAESTLADMTQLICTRLPTFVEDTKHPYIRKLVNTQERRQKKRKKRISVQKTLDVGEEATEKTKLIEDTNDNSSISPATDIVNLASGYDVVLTSDPPVDAVTSPDKMLPPVTSTENISEPDGDADSESDGSETVNCPKYHKEVDDEEYEDEDEEVSLSLKQMPYGLPCCRELIRFLISLINPLDRKNTESMVILGLNLLIVALEAMADHLPKYELVMQLVKDKLCRSLLQLLDTDKLPVFAATNRCCFLLFESMRVDLKFQLESYLKKLQSIVLSEKDPSHNGNEQKEMALESLVHLWRIPGLVTEMYLNFDCDLYCANIFEDLTKLLVENSFPTMGGNTASLLSLDALLVVIDTIEQNCEDRANGRGLRQTENAGESKKLDLPPLSGYDIGKKMSSIDSESRAEVIESVQLRANRHPPSVDLPSMAEVIEKKKRKRLIAEGTELFNQSPKKGIDFLRGKGILGHDEESLVQWLRTNPQLDKKSIADYICSRKHADVLKAFVQSFPFQGKRLDIALRMFLETFRLPGEAAEISMVMQYFSDEWYRANDEPFNHVDAAFTLSYAIIMLNMDQHNPQVKRAQPPMTVDCFKRNLSGTNGGEDFDTQMLVDIYTAIKSEEIVMPAEQKGLVKEDYLWKVLLRRGETGEGVFYHAPTGWNDHDLFAICWGPAVAALSYVFDKSENEQILQKALSGYRKCSAIAAHYGMNEVFDNLCIHLCKFTTLTSMTEGNGEESIELQRQRSMIEMNNGTFIYSPEGVALAFGENHKAQLATKTLFHLVHDNGNILREGWRNVFEVLLQLFKARLLPSDMTEVDDFVDEKGWVSIQRIHEKRVARAESTFFDLSWFGFGGSSNENDRKQPTQEQLASMKLASTVIMDSKPSQIVVDSKYLTTPALMEMLRAIQQNSAHVLENGGEISAEDEDALVFYLELMIVVTLENKDRLPLIWMEVSQHMKWLLSSRFEQCKILMERTVVGLLRVANRNLFRNNTVSDDILESLTMLLKLSSTSSFMCSKQIAYGLHELIRTNAANLHKKEHWAVLFELLEMAGAAIVSDEYLTEPSVGKYDRNAFSDVEQSSKNAIDEDRPYTSEGEERKQVGSTMSIDGDRWVALGHRDAAKAEEEALKALGAKKYKLESLVLRTGLGKHDPSAFLKVCECLAFLLRDAIHVTPDNFESSLQCLRTMVEASIGGGTYACGKTDGNNRLKSGVNEKKEVSTTVHEKIQESIDEEKMLSASYQQMSLHLIDLCSQLHSKAPAIFEKWSHHNGMESLRSVNFIWSEIWKPLLQAMARLSCDCRRQVRAASLTHLQRAFLPANMSNLGAEEWKSCFGEVLFPLLSKLLEKFSRLDPIGMEDTRVRTIQIVAKTLLNHLNTLSVLPSFPTLWLKLLDFMEAYLLVDSCGNLKEAVPESLKNMLLVMESTDIFATTPGLYEMTVERMKSFLPDLIKDTIPQPPKVIEKKDKNIEEKSQNIPSTEKSQDNSEKNISQTQDLTIQSENVLSEKSTEEKQEKPEEPPVPLTEVVVHSGPTSPVVGSPETSNYDFTALQYQQQAYNNYYQYQQYAQSPEAAAYYKHYEEQQRLWQQQQQQQQQQQLDNEQQRQQYYAVAPEHYAQYQQYAQPSTSSSATVHGQYARANPLGYPEHPIVTPSVNSAFTHVYGSQSESNVYQQSSDPQQQHHHKNEQKPQIHAPEEQKESPYFTPIPYNPPNNN